MNDYKNIVHSFCIFSLFAWSFCMLVNYRMQNAQETQIFRMHLYFLQSSYQQLLLQWDCREGSDLVSFFCFYTFQGKIYIDLFVTTRTSHNFKPLPYSISQSTSYFNALSLKPLLLKFQGQGIEQGFDLRSRRELMFSMLSNNSNGLNKRDGFSICEN